MNFIFTQNRNKNIEVLGNFRFGTFEDMQIVFFESNVYNQYSLKRGEFAQKYRLSSCH